MNKPFNFETYLSPDEIIAKAQYTAMIKPSLARWEMMHRFELREKEAEKKKSLRRWDGEKMVKYY